MGRTRGPTRGQALLPRGVCKYAALGTLFGGSRRSSNHPPRLKRLSKPCVCQVRTNPAVPSSATRCAQPLCSCCAGHHQPVFVHPAAGQQPEQVQRRLMGCRGVEAPWFASSDSNQRPEHLISCCTVLGQHSRRVALTRGQSACWTLERVMCVGWVSDVLLKSCVHLVERSVGTKTATTRR